MDNLKISKTDSSPEVNFDVLKSVLSINGKSYPEDTFDFYAPIIAWLEKYMGDSFLDKTEVNINIVYMNSATSQSLYDILDVFNNGNSTNVTINWYYKKGSEDGYEVFEDYSEDFPDLNMQGVSF